VVDRSRCDSCGACVEFCLFGVHAVGGDGKASVVSPGSCKDKCPACARVCPTGAIIFPKFDSAPINGGGSAVSADDGGDGPQGFQLPPEDLHAALAARRRGKGGGKGLFKKPPEGEEGSPR
jgi:NAD-dependent dihydropyrimidine dehydrogenase PreA subunit